MYTLVGDIGSERERARGRGGVANKNSRILTSPLHFRELASHWPRDDSLEAEELLVLLGLRERCSGLVRGAECTYVDVRVPALPRTQLGVAKGESERARGLPVHRPTQGGQRYMYVHTYSSVVFLDFCAFTGRIAPRSWLPKDTKRTSDISRVPSRIHWPAM